MYIYIYNVGYIRMKLNYNNGNKLIKFSMLISIIYSERKILFVCICCVVTWLRDNLFQEMMMNLNTIEWYIFRCSIH